MSDLRVLFDGIEVDDPTNWIDMESSLKDDDALRAILLIENTTFDFIGSAFDYIQAKIAEGFCSSIDVSIQSACNETYSDLILGRIFVSDVVINEKTCVASIKLRDRSFYASINNNKNVDVIPTTNQTKNLLPMTTATVYNLDVYGLNNALLSSNVPSYRIFELLRTCITFLTDGSVGFASTLFDIGGDFEGWCVTNGKMLRTVAVAEMTSTTFEKIIKELNARVPIRFTIDDPYGSPVFRIEYESYFRNETSTALIIDNIYEITRKFATEKLYSSIRVGSTITDTDVTLSFPESIRFLGFYDEKYTVVGKCNIDLTLDLSGDWIVSSNVIEDVTTNGNQGYDDNIFLFASTLTDASNGRTTNSNFLSLDPPLYYYNESLTNQAIINRYLGAFPNNLAAFAGAQGDGIFKAYLGSALAFGTGSVVDNSVNTTNVAVNTGSYFDGTDRFTAAVSGVYDISMFIEADVTSFSGTRADIAMRIRQFDSAGNLINTAIPRSVGGGSIFAYFTTGIVSRSLTARIVMNAGDYLNLSFTKVDSFGTLSSGSLTLNTYWQCDENTVGGGIFAESDYRDYPVNIFEFEYPLTKAQWDAIRNMPEGKILFSMSYTDHRGAYIKEIKYNHMTGVSTFSLINSATQNAS